MKILRRSKVTYRSRKGSPATFHPNFSGQGGTCDLVLETPDEFISLRFESEGEVRELLSQAHIVHHNWRDGKLK